MGKITTRSTFSLLFVLTGAFIPLTAFQSSELIITENTVINVICPGTSTGKIDVTVSGGDGSYVYSWAGPGSFTSTSEDISNLAAGTYTLTVTDEAETPATSTKEFVVDQIDTEKPASVTLSSATGECSVTVTAPTTTDNCAGTITGTTTDPLSYTTQGTHTINWKFDDGNGNVYTTTQNVVVDDTTKPQAVTIPNVTGECSATATAPTTSDNCAGTITGTTTDPLSYTTQGTHIINWKFDDGNGNIYTTTQNIVVDDVTKPQAVALPDVIGECSASTTAPTTTDNCAGTITGTTADPLSYTTQGTHIINWKFDDGNGNIYTTTQNIIVDDVTKPQAVALPNVIGECSASTTAPTTTDNCAGTITGTTTDPLSYTTQGTHTINWTFDDGNGNITIVPQNIVIDDVTAPTAPVLENINWGCSYTVATPVVSDNCGGTVTGTTISPVTYSTPGIYPITWTFDDGNGNSSTATQNITITPIVFEPVITSVSCNGNSDGVIKITASGGVAPLSYSINGGQYSSNSTFDNLPAGDHAIRIKDSNDCIVDEIISVTEPVELAMTAPSSMLVSCYGGSDGTVTVGTVSGGTAPYTYSIDNTNFVSNTTFTDLSAGTHTIFVVDANGCSLQKTVTINQPEQITATINKTDVSCFEGSDGIIEITGATGGSNTFEYSIDNLTWQASSEFIELTAGSHPVYIRDAAAPECIITLDPALEITQPKTPVTATVATTRTTVFGTATGTATASPTGGTPGYTYEWRKVGEPAILQTTRTATGLFAGNYEVTIKDSKCTNSIVIPIEIIDALQAYIVSRTLCEGDETTIRTTYFEVENLTAVGGTAPYTYIWDFGTDAVEPIKTGIGEHKVTYTTTGNKTITLTIEDSAGETLKVTQQQYIGKCYEPCGKSENIVFDPNNFYLGDINGNPIDLQTNCDQDKYIFLAVDKSANAYNPYIELVYTLTDKDGATRSFPVKGCRDSAAIDDDPSDGKENKIGGFIRFTLEPIGLICGEESFQIENFYITWTNVSKKDCGQNNNAFCYSIAEPHVLPTPVDVKAIPNEILCFGDESGIIKVKASGGFAPYKYSLTGESTSYQTRDQFINLAAGDYTVYVQDARGNSDTETVTILGPHAPVTGEVTMMDPLCFGEIGEATVTGSGGTPFTDASGDPYYEYLWNDPNAQTTATAEGLKAGEYTVTVIDANGCQEIATVTITEPVELPTANAGEDQTFSCGLNTATLAGNDPGTGVGTWTIIEAESPAGGTITSPNDPFSNFSGAPGIEGTYTLAWAITDTLGNCATVDTVKITYLGNCSTLDFDGVDDHIIFPNTAFPLTSGSFSIETWIKPHSVDGIRTIFSKRNADDLGAGGFDLVINSGAPTFRWGNNSVTTANKISSDRWYHLAVVYENSKIVLYVDGIPVGNSTSAVNPADISAPFMAGAMYSATNLQVPKNFYHGWIQEVRIWNTALTTDQLHFMLNQEIVSNEGVVKGEVLPMNVPGDLSWSNLIGYYKMDNSGGGITKGVTGTPSPEGKLINITTTQERTAPLPYFTIRPGNWRDMAIASTPWKYGAGTWDAPNSLGINGEPINWNIVKISHDLNSGDQNITLLGLISEAGELNIPKASMADRMNIPGQSLRITHYLKLDGAIDLIGESQLLQDVGSILAESSSGYIERDQQGTRSSYNYNYWSSPVSTIGAPNNSGYNIESVLYDGTNPANPQIINFGTTFRHADGALANPIKISSYWLNTYTNFVSNTYSKWNRINPYSEISAGEGFTMKGSSGAAAITDRQNYVFIGKPNNGVIELNLTQGNDYLVGNPYPSAIDSEEFILDNISDSGGNNDKNVFNGTLYFWDHFAGKTHYLKEYVGGYATLNLSGGIVAVATDERINATGEEADEDKKPKRFIPVGQGFYISTNLAPELSEVATVSGGLVQFNNSQRVFKTDDGAGDESVFKSRSKIGPDQKMKDERSKIWIKFSSPAGYHRQLLVTKDPLSSSGFDLGFDAPLIENNKEDMYWVIDSLEFVIQGVPDLNKERELALGVKTIVKGEFSIAIDELRNIPRDFEIYLKDSVTRKRHDLRVSAFVTTDTAGIKNERYFLVFQPEPVADSEENEEEDEQEEEEEEEEEANSGEGQDNPDDEGNTGDGDAPSRVSEELSLHYSNKNQVMVIQNPQQLPIIQGSIYNVLGQAIQEFNDIPQETEVKLPVVQHPEGVYIMRLQLENNHKSIKFIMD